MPGDFFEAKPRDFNPMSVSGLPNEARDGVNAALEAVSTWRNEIAATNEKNGKRVMLVSSVFARHPPPAPKTIARAAGGTDEIGKASDIRSGSRMCENSDAELARRISISISSAAETQSYW